ncbi:hypothetical protein C8R43DRAFT_1229332 [Mycena crocata]|nr:hypothetical protein C8R43DRAFT_1229332 [Mycena crocata]
MHPGLRLSALSGLPSSIQKIARSAATGNLYDLIDLQSATAGLPFSQTPLLLPVFYMNLQITDIPAPAELESAVPGSKSSIAITKAGLALRGLYRTDGRHLPFAVSSELWPRLWGWGCFLHAFHEQFWWLDDPLSEFELCLGLLSFIGSFQTHRAAAPLISTTPGLRFMIGRAWSFLNEASNIDSVAAGYHFLSSFLVHHMNAKDRTNLEELAEGAGGSLGHLALLVVAHIDRFLPSPNNTMSESDEFYLRGALAMILESQQEARPRSEDRMIVGPLTEALIPHGIVRALTAVARALPQCGTSAAEASLDKCFILLGCTLSSDVGYKLLPEALEAGLLVAIISAGRWENTQRVYGHLLYFVTGILRVALVYHDVLLAIEAAVPEILELEKDEQFTRSEIFVDWMAFRDLSLERIQVFSSFSKEKVLASKACDNLQCSKITTRTEFQRCSGCQSSYYCSTECQTHDWRHGNHQDLCVPRRSFCLNENTHLSSRDRGFMRALIHHAYSKTTDFEVHVPEIEFMHAHPDTEYFTLFDFTAHRVDISVHPAADADALSLLGPHWPAEVARAARSGGRIRLHVMYVAEGDVYRHWFVPLRSDTPRVHDGLRAIAEALPRHRDAWDMLRLVEDIQALVHNDDDPAIEIH